MASSFFASLTSLPARVNNEFVNPESVMRTQLRGAVAAVASSAAGAAETAADSTTVARRELGDATVAVGSLVARLATSVSGALRDGDRIALDAPAGTLELLGSDEELARRRAAWVRPPPAMARGYVSMYVANVNQADEGCDFGYLQGASGAPVPRESH